MAKEATKAAKLATVESKEKYCDLLEKAITQAKIKTASDDYERAMLDLKIHELENKLKIHKEIAADFRNDYEVVFLPKYDQRLEECYKNFAEYHDFIKKHVEELKGNVGIYTSIVSYDQENPDNKDEDNMLLYYETIKPLVRILKDKKR